MKDRIIKIGVLTAGFYRCCDRVQFYHESGQF